MELLIDKIYDTIYFKNSSLSIKEKTIAIILGLGPFLIACVYFLIR